MPVEAPAFVDIHHHLLYGLDDGPTQRAGMEQMLRIATRAGVRTLIATPHIAPGVVPFSPDAFEQRLGDAQQLARALGLPLRLLPGSELRYTSQAPRYLAERRVPTLGASPRVLVAFPVEIHFADLQDALLHILRRGYAPVISHVERYPCLMRVPQRVPHLRLRGDVRVQLNAAALLNADRGMHRTLRRLLLDGQIDYVASDAHDADQRACRLGEAFERLATLVGVQQASALTGNGLTAEAMLLR